MVTVGIIDSAIYIIARVTQIATANTKVYPNKHTIMDARRENVKVCKSVDETASLG